MTPKLPLVATAIVIAILVTWWVAGSLAAQHKLGLWREARE